MSAPGKRPVRVVVRAPNWTGDVIMATPGFRALRAGLPDARITLHVREPLAPLLAGAPWFDAVVPLGPWRGPVALLREAARLRRAGPFDLGLCLPDSFSSALLMRAAGVREVVGYARGGRAALLHRKVPLPAAKQRSGSDAGGRLLLARELHVLGLVEAIGAPARGTTLELFVTPAEQAECDARLAERGLDPEAPLALLAPGASFGPSKLWPAGYFARVGDALVERGLAVAVIGTPGERALGRAIAAAMRTPPVDLCGAVGLGALKAVVRRARLLVCNDAGARHVGVAFGVPCVVPMGPTALEKTNLNLERVRVLTAEVACRPCYRRVCPIDHRCMTGIAPDAVIAAASAALATGGAAAEAAR